MPERIRRRRPIAWNQLLNKGHVHDAGRSATRRAQRQALDADLDEYFNNPSLEIESDSELKEGPDSGAKDGADLAQSDRNKAVSRDSKAGYRGAICNAVQICTSTSCSLSNVR